MKEIIFKIKRFNPLKDKRSHFEKYKIPVKHGQTVLDSLIYIKEEIEPSLSMRYSCRMGICGSCGMSINGKPELACHTQVLELKSELITLEPMRNYPLVKDLVVDMGTVFEKHKRIKPYIIRTDKQEQENPTREYIQKPEEIEKYLQFSYCIKCGLCTTLCPSASTDTKFLAPFVLAQAYRYSVDTRDEGFEERLKVLDSPHSLWNCHFATGCSVACPKGIDPALSIQLLKKMTVAKSLGFYRKKKPSPVVPPIKEPCPDKDKVPSAPPATVK